MIMVRVRYDRCNGPLEILDEEREALFEGDDVYMLAIFGGNGTDVEWIDFCSSAISDAAERGSR